MITTEYDTETDNTAELAIVEDEAILMEQEKEVAIETNETIRRKGLAQGYRNSPVYLDKIRRRLKVNDACYKAKEARAMIYNAFSSNPDADTLAANMIDFINLFGFTFDPRPQAEYGDLPFILYDYQEELIRWYCKKVKDGEDGLIEKSRDMGATWTIFVWCSIYMWLFGDGINILIGSYKEDLCDNHTKDSILGMIDYGVKSLPKWIMPRGWNPSKHRTHMKFINPMNYNQITGDTMNPDFGRGTRKTVILFDELGFWDYGKEAWESASQTTACRIANGTPKGPNFYAYLANQTNISKATLHWKLHPLKDQKWYEYECSRSDPAAIAQELDISYSKSQDGRVYPEWDDINVSLGNYPYNPAWPLYVSWDFGNNDATAIIWSQKNPLNGKLRIVDTYTNTGKVISFYTACINGFVTNSSYKYTNEEIKMIDEHRSWNKATHFGDPAGRFKNAVTNQTVVSILRDNGINVNFKDAWKYFDLRKQATRDLINKGIELNDNARTRYFNSCILSAAYPKSRVNGLELIRSEKPKHDGTSHYRSSLEYLSLGLKEVTREIAKIYDRPVVRSRLHSRRGLSY